MYVKKGFCDSCFILDYYFLIIFKILVNYVGKKRYYFLDFIWIFDKIKVQISKIYYFKINL